jgi:predicted flavoprotein YhiN
VSDAAPDVIVLGGGAAGLWCAAGAGRRGRRVLVREHNERGGKKILISGGGRANFTNRRVGAEHFVSKNPHFARSALARCPPETVVAMVDAHRIPYHERRHGQLFCDDSAKRITAMLLAECEASGVTIRTGCRVDAVRAVHAAQSEQSARPGRSARSAVGVGATAGAGDGARYVVECSGGDLRCRSLVVATGGLSYARLGASDLGYRIARQFGLAIVPPRPGLVPLQWSRAERPRWAELAGVAAPARVSCGDAAFEEATLFTHAGLSGPALLQVSNYWRLGQPVRIDWLPGRDLRAELRARKAAGERVNLGNALAERLPKRLAEQLVHAPAAARPLAQCADADIEATAAAVHTFSFRPAEDAGWEKAEVTLGGVDTAELSSRTLEARRSPGLHFIGEVVDVTGWLGGYNFQWAWASAQAAGEAV